MCKVYKKISKISRHLVKFLFALSPLLFMNSCSTFDEVPLEPRKATPREQMFTEAEKLFISHQDEAAKTIYSKLTRNAEGRTDSIYDKALWRLVKIYEKSNESEKALLTLDELYKRNGLDFSKNKIKFALMKNHFRANNFYEAIEIRKDLDRNYKFQNMELPEVYDSLLNTADMAYDEHTVEELKFLGEIQKYFVYVMESNLEPMNEMLTSQLIELYNGFYAVANRGATSADLKKQILFDLLFQLKKFDQYVLEDTEINTRTIGKFLKYSVDLQKQILTGVSK